MQIFECKYLILVLGAACTGTKLRVYQGTEDLLGEFPFIVALDLKLTVKICTGSLIADSWVITAGHCLSRFPAKVITTRYSDFTMRPNETKAYVKSVKMYLHPSFSERNTLLRNDIGLILTQKVPTNSFVKLLAVDYKSLLGLPVKYAGFGATTKKKQSLTQVLKEDKFKPLQVGEGVVTTCPPRRLAGWLPSVCVAPKCSVKKQMPYVGDSGGPLVCSGKLVALVSGLSRTWAPITMFSPVSPYLDWIMRSLGKNETNNLIVYK